MDWIVRPLTMQKPGSFRKDGRGQRAAPGVHL